MSNGIGHTPKSTTSGPARRPWCHWAAATSPQVQPTRKSATSPAN